MSTRKIDLYLSPAGAQCKILIDGEEIKNCRAVRVITSVDEVTVVALELINVEVSVHGEVNEENLLQVMDVTSLQDDTRRFQKVVL